MADQSELRMNLAAVKRADPYAKEIVETSAHVAFYTFNYEDNEWEKTDVEGAFFVYKRTAEPFHSIFINNRLNTDSLVEPVTADLELQAQPPFLLYRNERSRIRGFWFYNKDELERVAGLVNGLIKECQKRQQQQQQQSHRPPGGPPPQLANMMGNHPAQQNNIHKSFDIQTNGGGGGGLNGQQIQQQPPKNPINIFSMLSKAQEEFYNSAGNGHQPPQQQQQQHQQQQPPQMTNSHQPPATMTGESMLAALLPKMNVGGGVPGGQPPPPSHHQPTPLHVQSQSVMNFFAAATKPPTSINSQPPQQTHPGPPQMMIPPQQQHSNGGPHTVGGLKVASPGPPLLQRLLSNPVHTVEQIEMQHRAVTPQEVRPATSDEGHGAQLNAENGFNWKVLKREKEGKVETKAPKAPPTVVTTNGNVKGDSSWAALFQAGGGGGEAGEAKEKKGGVGNKGTTPSTPGGSGSGTGKPALMTPTMFKKSAEPLSKEDPTNPSLIPTGVKPVVGGGGGAAAGKKVKAGNVDLRMKPEPLTQSQMLQAMTYLMKTDQEFMKKLHEAYLKSFAEMMAP